MFMLLWQKSGAPQPDEPFLFPCQAYAYLDPGTGSMILQGIIGGLAAAAVVAKIYWHRLLLSFGLRKDNSPDAQRINLHEKTHDATSNPDRIIKKGNHLQQKTAIFTHRVKRKV